MEGKEKINLLISIITVCYNSEDTIKDTIESVLNQTYKNIEYILVDGESSDSTIDIIKSYEKEAKEKGIIYKWVSEPDKGIYDAMNKGIRLCTGSWIIFMNAGDEFYSENVIDEFINKEVSSEIGLIYGDTNLVYSNNHRKVLKNNNFNRVKLLFYTINHQSIFFNRDAVIKSGLYNLKYRIVADKDLILKIFFNKKYKFKYINNVVANYDMNGLSSNYENLLKEKKEMTKEYFSKTEYLLFLLFEKIREVKIKIWRKL